MKLYFPLAEGNCSCAALMKYQEFLIALVPIHTHRKLLKTQF